MKLKWKVGLKPTGPYRGFAKRSWPSATYTNGDTAGHLASFHDNGYHPSLAETERMIIYVALYHTEEERRKKGYFSNCRIKKEVVGVTAAKALLQWYLDNHPQTHRVTRATRDDPA